MAAAINMLDMLIQPPDAQRLMEATVMLASLRAHPQLGVPNADVVQEKKLKHENYLIGREGPLNTMTRLAMAMH